MRLKSSSSRLSFLPNPKNDMPARAKEGEEHVPAHKTQAVHFGTRSSSGKLLASMVQHLPGQAASALGAAKPMFCGGMRSRSARRGSMPTCPAATQPKPLTAQGFRFYAFSKCLACVCAQGRSSPAHTRHTSLRRRHKVQSPSRCHGDAAEPAILRSRPVNRLHSSSWSETPANSGRDLLLFIF